MQAPVRGLHPLITFIREFPMKLIALVLILASLGVADVHAEPKAVTPDPAATVVGPAWRITHADAANVPAEGKQVIRLIAEGDSANGIVGLALPPGTSFSTGTIALDLKGKNVRQRSFLGVAFNVIDAKTFEAVYFRPFNFRADEPMRNRAVQYIAWPDNTWEHLRKSAPGAFENAVNPVPDPDAWFHAEIEVTDEQVRVFVNHAREPSLVTRRLSKGGVLRPAGLFVDSSDGHYSGLSVMPLKFHQPQAN
jgi:hypothetical protein